jgi:hypothetical protein
VEKSRLREKEFMSGDTEGEERVNWLALIVHPPTVLLPLYNRK